MLALTIYWHPIKLVNYLREMSFTWQSSDCTKWNHTQKNEVITKESILLNTMFHALKGRFQLEQFQLSIFPPSSHSQVVFYFVNTTFSTGLVVSSVSWLGQLTIVGLVWAVNLGVHITIVGRTLYIGSFGTAMTSLSRYFHLFKCVYFSMVIFKVYFGHGFLYFFISCPSISACSENLDLPSAYLKSFLCSLNPVLEFMLVLPL